jgi:hypothetical protein
MSGEINLEPTFGKDLENAVENITPAFGRDHVTCNYLTIDESYVVRGEMEIEYKAETDNPAHDPIGIGVGFGPPTIEATWTIKFSWQVYYLNTLASDIVVQAAGNLPAVAINTPFIQQRISEVLNGHAPAFGQYVHTTSPPQGEQQGPFPLEFPPESAYKEYAIIRFVNQTPFPLTLQFQWNPTSPVITESFASGDERFWWVVTDQQFWQVFQNSPPTFNINNGFGGRIPQVQISKLPFNPVWGTPSTISGKVECNMISVNDLEQFGITPGIL